MILLWYGLYFGILGRDLAEVASEQMVRKAGSLTTTCSLASLLASWHSTCFGLLDVQVRHGCNIEVYAASSCCPSNICYNLCLLQGNAIGVGKRLTSTVNSCGICGGELKDTSHLGEEVCGWLQGMTARAKNTQQTLFGTAAYLMAVL